MNFLELNHGSHKSCGSERAYSIATGISKGTMIKMVKIITFPKQSQRSRACGVNFCRTFISSISLFLELAGSDLAQTLLNPPKVVWRWLYL